MQLRQTEFVGTVNQNGVGGWNVDAGFDNGGADQNVETAMIKILHHLLQFAFVHLAMGDVDLGFGQEFAHVFRHLFDAVDIVVSR